MEQSRHIDDAASPQSHARRDALKCMLWAGTGVLCTISGGIPRSQLIGSAQAATPDGELSFLQISDSHIGFAALPNTDVAATLTEAIDHVKKVKGKAALLIHTGDVCCGQRRFCSALPWPQPPTRRM